VDALTTYKEIVRSVAAWERVKRLARKPEPEKAPADPPATLPKVRKDPSHSGVREGLAVKVSVGVDVLTAARVGGAKRAMATRAERVNKRITLHLI
jgi:hypothetical protein